MKDQVWTDTHLFGDSYRGKRVLVTGHTGFKGSWLTYWLLKLGAKVAGYSIDIPSQPSLFETLQLQGKIEHHIADILDLPHLAKVCTAFKPEVIFHLAAQPIVSTSFEDPATTFRTNAIGTLNIMEIARSQAGINAVVMITSDKCYENVEWEYGYRESDKLGGKDPYSASKACAELVIWSYWRSYFASTTSSLKLASGRAGNVIGGGDWARDRIVPDCYRSWSRGAPVHLRSPNSTRPWQHVLEPISGYLALGQQLLAGNPVAVGEAFNFGPGAEVNQPVGHLVSALGDLWGKDAKTHLGTNQLREASLLKLCCDKALNRLSWIPTLTYHETVAMTGAWYNNYYNQSQDSEQFTTRQIEQYQGLARERGRHWATPRS